MTKVKKIISVLLVTLTLLCTCFIAAGCPKSDDKQDITIIVVCWRVNGFNKEIVDKWIFTPDVSELQTELEYDGNQYRYDVYAYTYSDNPDENAKWYSPPSDGASIFLSSLTKRAEGDELPYACDKGEYTFYSYADSTSTTWNSKSIWLYITIK